MFEIRGGREEGNTLRIWHCMHPVYPLPYAQGLKVYFAIKQRRNYGVDVCIGTGGF
jgi:hypothetical protein